MAYQSLRSEYMRIPPVTRVYTTACVLTTLAVVHVINFCNFFCHRTIKTVINRFFFFYVLATRLSNTVSIIL